MWLELVDELLIGVRFVLIVVSLTQLINAVI